MKFGKLSKSIKGFLFTALGLVLTCMTLSVSGRDRDDNASSDRSTLTVRTISSADRTPVAGVFVKISPYEIWSETDEEGITTFENIKAGNVTLRCSILGYGEYTRSIGIPSDSQDTLTVVLEPVSLKMKEVTVVASASRTEEGTASHIGRQAIDHLQATSLKDILQLLPGNVLSSNPSLTGMGQFSSRTMASGDYNNSFGGAIIVDGIPMSNNANMNEYAGTLSTAGRGIDLRSIATDNIESIEVIRGIPSAKYGDLSSGAMIIKSKTGRSPLNVRGKIMPGITQASIEKGIDAGKAGIFNLSADYAHGKSDPRYSTDLYDRGILSVIHSIGAGERRNWTFTTKLGLKYIRDWAGADPSEPEIVRDMYEESIHKGIDFSHSAKAYLKGSKLSGTFNYSLGISFAADDNRETDMITPAGFNAPVFNAITDGTHWATHLPAQYEASGGTQGRPVNIFASSGYDFFLGSDSFSNNISLGAEFRSEGNLGIGYYNNNPDLPLNSIRSRAFKDVPFLNQLSFFAEDMMRIKAGTGTVSLQAGLRYTLLQPGRTEQKGALMPRINLSYRPVDFFSLHLGYGVSAKMPGLLFLYPEKSYLDAININVTMQGVPFTLYTTSVIDNSNPELRPMKNEKSEIGFTFSTDNGMSYSVVVFREKVTDGFGSIGSEWKSIFTDKWNSSGLSVSDGTLVFDKENPSYTDTTLYQTGRPGNTETNRTWGIEYDFNFGQIEATNTSFFLSGAYMSSRYWTDNGIYREPVGNTDINPTVYVIYPQGSPATVSRRFSSTFRIVQHIPAIGFIVSAAVQAVFYDYSKSVSLPEYPAGYIKPDPSGNGKTVFIGFTEEQINDPDFRFEGFLLKDQIYEPSVYNLAERWPPLWAVNLRVTKELGKNFGFSFYVNNFFFHQPWHTSTTSSGQVERQSSLFSYGFEFNMKF